jgi:lipoprotein-releasing system permease protein
VPRTPFELSIGRRYLRSTGNRFLSFISLISMVGVAIGVAVLIVVLSVMNGFEHELRARILSLTSHATVTAFGEGLSGWQAMREVALRNPRVRAAAPFVESETLLIADRAQGASSAATLRGIAPSLEAQVSSLGERMTSGSMAALRPGEFSVILGEELAAKLGVAVGDAVVVAVAKGNVTPAGVVPRLPLGDVRDRRDARRGAFRRRGAPAAPR